MAYFPEAVETEKLLSSHAKRRWLCRQRELSYWVDCPKPRRRAKRTALLGNVHVDEELLSTLSLFKRIGIETEFSCAGVSLLDEPEDHSLYAYITIRASEKAAKFVDYAMAFMRHRLVVTFESERGRYDLSSFFIGHNRSFCILMEQCARSFLKQGPAGAAFHQAPEGSKA